MVQAKKTRSILRRENPLSVGGELNQPANYSAPTSRQLHCLQLLTCGKKWILAWPEPVQIAREQQLIYHKMVHRTIAQNSARANHHRSSSMKPGANFVIHFIDRVRSRLSGRTHDAAIAAMHSESNAAHMLHSSVIRMRSRLQSA
jgi:hypothetical protein